MKKQFYTSANTSINKSRMPRVYSIAADLIRGKVIDYGCGRYFDNYDFSRFPATITGYDKFNRPDAAALAARYDLAVCSNVLNVIAEEEIRAAVLADLMALAPVAVITVYEGNRSGEGAATMDDCYQLNRRARDYMPELEKVYGPGNVTLQYGYFVCRRPD